MPVCSIKSFISALGMACIPRKQDQYTRQHVRYICGFMSILGAFATDVDHFRPVFEKVFQGLSFTLLLLFFYSFSTLLLYSHLICHNDGYFDVHFYSKR